MYEDNLLSQWHLRYGSYGGIGYYHVSDQYIALFSHFIACGVFEGLYVFDGLTKNTSDIQPDAVHGDTHSQNEPAFGLSYLLGIKLMPRIRNFKHLTFYRPSNDTKYTHIDGLFTDTINWELIETHLPDMLRIALSIRRGKLTPSTLLRRLSSYSRRNKLYLAFRELGRVIRTCFLLDYLASVELRSTIQAATCKSEEFNQFINWVMFGSKGIIAENLMYEQRKIIKYSHLVANLVILHNVVAMTHVINDLVKQGHKVDTELLRQLGPYRTQHINRFGIYVLNLDRDVPPLNYELALDLAA